MQLNFIFPKDITDPNKCNVARAICDGVAEMISLPDTLTIEFSFMPQNVYGNSTLDNKSSKMKMLMTSVLPLTITCCLGPGVWGLLSMFYSLI